ncbi:type II toxin-antitoxin system RelE/ParE family toxin [Enterovirga rhinocerotis]|nr:type II toxin-antitoxin system RelE/ParE family toxin [Enterovirga rhinocerotis]
MTSYRVVFSPEARRHLEALTTYIARQSSPDRAVRFARSIVEYCAKLSHMPHRGIRRDDTRPGLRMIGFRRSVTIVFDTEAETVTILGIHSRGHDIQLLD